MKSVKTTDRLEVKLRSEEAKETLEETPRNLAHGQTPPHGSSPRSLDQFLYPARRLHREQISKRPVLLPRKRALAFGADENKTASAISLRTLRSWESRHWRLSFLFRLSSFTVGDNGYRRVIQ